MSKTNQNKKSAKEWFASLGKKIISGILATSQEISDAEDMSLSRGKYDPSDPRNSNYKW